MGETQMSVSIGLLSGTLKSGEKTLSICFLKGIKLAASVFAAELRGMFASFSIFTVASNPHHMKYLGRVHYFSEIYIWKGFYYFVWGVGEEQMLIK